jgi:threonine/homoserine/homoserine lactone efflux protein
VAQTSVLGGLFLGLAVVTDLLYVLLASSARSLISDSHRARKRRKELSGVTYLGLGLFAALSGGSNHD